MNYKLFIIIPFLCLFSFCTQSNWKQKDKTNFKTIALNLDIQQDQPQVKHGLAQLQALTESGVVKFVDAKADYRISSKIDSVNLKPEAYKIEVSGKDVLISGGDAVGIMYALLEIKDQLQNTGQKISAKQEAPELAFRAIKFNLPWDPYRASNFLRSHTEVCRDTLFWRDFLDMMTENRFNKLTLWNLHPFDFMVKTKKYPEACRFSDAEMAEWETFWHSLFRMAKDRGIETYLVNWNIFVPMELLNAHGIKSEMREKGSSGGAGETSEIVKDYMREVVRTTIDTYPNLTGLGITLGEGMGGMTAEEREEWLLDSFIAGVRQAKRKIKFIHRVPLSAGTSPAGSTSASVEQMTRCTLDTLTCFDGPMNIELKFNWSHGHSSAKLVKVHGGELTDTYWNPLPTNYYLAWMIRNEDFFILRWGQTDFIREHIARNVQPYVNGYYVGSETYIPAVDYYTSLEGASYKYAFERQWLFYKTWGRLLYNPHTNDNVFEDAFENKFPGYGKTLFSAQNKTSKIPLVIASWFNGWWDFTLYSEGFLGFNEDRQPAVELLSLETMIEREPLEPGYMSVKEYVKNNGQDKPGKITPIELADSVNAICLKALDEIKDIEYNASVDLRYELTDIKAWAYLGMYFSHKLRAAVCYKKYQDTSDNNQLSQSVEWLEKATADWDILVEVTTPVYDPMPVSHVGYRRNDSLFHWSIIQEQVHAELAKLKNDSLE